MSNASGTKFTLAAFTASAVLLQALDGVAQGANGTAPTSEVSEAARALYREGARFASQGLWREAREQFAHALQLRESPLLHYNLALACENSGYLVEALDHFRSFLRLDNEPASHPRRVLATRAIAVIEPVVAHIVIDVQQPGSDIEIALDGRPIPAALWNVAISVDPGEHFIDARSTTRGISQQSTVVSDGQSVTVGLQWTAPPNALSTSHADAGVDSLSPDASTGAVIALSATLPVRQAPTAPLSTIERIRRAIVSNAQARDVNGDRPWERNIAFSGFVGTGHPAGILGVGIRWAPRPWYELEANIGVGHPFGVGVTFMPAMFRAPLSHQFALGAGLGLGTNFTNLPSSNIPLSPGQMCRGPGPFTPMWLMLAMSAEFRILGGAIAARFLAGVRYLANNAELIDALQARCVTARTSYEPRDLLYDPPTLDHSVFPLFPWFSFEVGYAL